MKKILILFCIIIFSQMAKAEDLIGMPNPWTNCEQDFACGAKVSGVEFFNPKFNVRGMDNILEINYPISNNRIVTIRKGKMKETEPEDISGVYTYFSVSRNVVFNDTYKVKTRGDETKINVANFEYNDMNYSIYCKGGLSLEELEKIHSIILIINSI